MRNLRGTDDTPNRETGLVVFVLQGVSSTFMCVLHLTSQDRAVCHKVVKHGAIAWGDVCC